MRWLALGPCVTPADSMLVTAPMAIKDILQSLIDDAMVDQDKVGSANYFWAFPSKAASAVF